MNSIDPKQDIKPLKIGLLTDSSEVSYYVKDIIEWSMQEKNLQITHCIVHSKANDENNISSKSLLIKFVKSLKQHGIMQICANILLRFIQSLEHYFLQRKPIYNHHLVTYNIHDFALPVLYTHPIVSPSKHIHQFNPKDLELIQACNFDVLIHCGSLNLNREILNASKFGVISLGYADNNFYRGGPAGFWEVYENNPFTSFVVQNTVNKEVFISGCINTKPYWLFNQAHLYTQANHYFKIFLKKLIINQQLPEPLPKKPYSQRLYKNPNTIECLSYFKTLIKNYFREKNRHGKWRVSFIRHHWIDSMLCKGIELPPQEGFGQADPFLYHKDGVDYCFLEEICSKTKKGTIAVYEIGLSNAKRLGTVLDESFHLSHPFLFEYEDTLFMMPECSESKEIRLYECMEFPSQWKFKKTIMSGVSAADSILIEHDGLWWLLTSLDGANIGEHLTELSLFSAETPISTQWVPHPLNPIYIDAKCARNGGFFKIDNIMYRVSQNHGIGTYGQSIQINIIEEMNSHHFKEHPISQLLPGFKPKLQGFHHFHTTGNLSVFDYNER